jgi:hypothetical protein
MHGPREQPAEAPGGSITIPQSELVRRGDHASLPICGFIHSLGRSMIDIIQSGKR